MRELGVVPITNLPDTATVTAQNSKNTGALATHGMDGSAAAIWWRLSALSIWTMLVCCRSDLGADIAQANSKSSVSVGTVLAVN